jgi:predicted kinase
VEKSTAQEEARRYFHLAYQYAQKMNRPLLILVCGLMGTGKSTLARALAEALSWNWVSSDILRKEMAQISPRERRYENFHQGIYAPDFSRMTYQALFDRARTFLEGGSSVILDASFKKEKDRSAALSLALQMNADFLSVECTCKDEIVRERLARRMHNHNQPSDGRWELFQKQKEDFEKFEGVASRRHLTLDTHFSLDDCLKTVFQHLLQQEAREFSPEP